MVTAVVIDHVAEHPVYCNHHTPAMYGLQSYISMPIFMQDGQFYGTLCAIDPKPARLNNPTKPPATTPVTVPANIS